MPGLVDPGSVTVAKTGSLLAPDDSSAKTDKIVKPAAKRHRSTDSAKTKVDKIKPPLQAPVKRTDDPKRNVRSSDSLEVRTGRSTIPRVSGYIPNPPSHRSRDSGHKDRTRRSSRRESSTSPFGHNYGTNAEVLVRCQDIERGRQSLARWIAIGSLSLPMRSKQR